MIETRGLTRAFRLGGDEVRALAGVDFVVRRGEFVAIMGSSGSGKSTLMNILGCLDRPTGGHYLLEGTDVSTLDEPTLAGIRSRRIGFVFQSFNLLPRTSALENVSLPLFYAGRPADGGRRAMQALAALGLAGRERNAPNQLSGGQQQRVAIARALINDPAILLADEPTGNLDSKTANEIMATLRTFQRDHGLTVVLVTHEPDMASFADRVITMRDGRIVSDRPNAPPASTRPTSRSPSASAGGFAPVSPGSMAGAASLAWMALLAASRAIARNKLRSALTMLGIFIGVAALIAMVAVGQGANAAVKAQIESLGTNLVIVVPGATTTGGVRAGYGSASTLTVADAEAIRKEAPAAAEVGYFMRAIAQAQVGNQNWATSVQGVTPNFLRIRDWTVVSGQALTEEDERNAARVALLGRSVVGNLFGDGVNPVGAVVTIKSVPVTVVGVLAAKGQTTNGQDQDDVILIPFSTAERRILGVTAPGQAQSTLSKTYPPPPNPFGAPQKMTGFVSSILVQAEDAARVPALLEQTGRILRRRHHVEAGQTDDFGMRNMSDVAQAAEGSSRVMALLLATVASISLLVGGIGIMNILLVSVTERTREIGIRMAIGARRTHVLLQFLVESVLLSVGGGAAGILFGLALSWGISKFAGWPVLLSPLAVIGAFLFSAAVGAFFGYHPARRAARLNPIEALRYE